MSAPVPALLDGLHAAPAHIIHIGAGQAQALDAYLASGAAQITLIEADPDIAAELEARTGAEDRVQVICAAVSAAPGARPFHRTSLPELNAFHAPDGAPALFPGLRMLSSDPLPAVAPAELISSLSAAGDGPELLVIEAFGEALGIVQALAKADLLTRFERLHVQEARATIYSDIAPIEALQGALREAGFQVAPDPASDDADLPVLIARFDPEEQLHQQIARLTAERDRAQARVAELEAGPTEKTLRAELAELTATCETLRGALESKTRELAQAEQMAQYRLSQGREEVLRLEGQIRLIRELLLNGTTP